MIRLHFSIRATLVMLRDVKEPIMLLFKGYTSHAALLTLLCSNSSSVLNSAFFDSKLFLLNIRLQQWGANLRSSRTN